MLRDVYERALEQPGTEETYESRQKMEAKQLNMQESPADMTESVVVNNDQQ